MQAPLLLLHGLLDDIVPPEASEEWAQALRQASKTFEYKTYADEPHGFLHRANRLDAWQRIEHFLNWHLMPRYVHAGCHWTMSLRAVCAKQSRSTHEIMDCLQRTPRNDRDRGVKN